MSISLCAQSIKLNQDKQTAVQTTAEYTELLYRSTTAVILCNSCIGCFCVQNFKISKKKSSTYARSSGGKVQSTHNLKKSTSVRGIWWPGFRVFVFCNMLQLFQY